MAPASSQHRPTPVDPVIDDVEVIVLWEKVFINQMSATLLRRRAFPIAILNETAIDLLTSRLPRLVQGVVILGNVQRKIVRCGEVAAALEAAVDVRLGVVHFIRFIGGEGQGLPMRRQRAKHHVGSSSGGGGGGERGGSPVKVTITVEMGVFGWLFASFRRSRRCAGA